MGFSHLLPDVPMKKPMSRLPFGPAGVWRQLQGSFPGKAAFKMGEICGYLAKMILVASMNRGLTRVYLRHYHFKVISNNTIPIKQKRLP